MDKKIYKYFFLIIFITFININLIAQAPLDKKGAWGINFGLNYYYPTIKNYSYYSEFSGTSIVEESYSITLTGNIGKYLEISRIIRLCKIDDKNSFNLLIGFSYNQRKATQKYDGWMSENGGRKILKEGLKYYEAKYPSLDIKFNNILNFNNKYGVFNAIGFKTNFSTKPNYYTSKHYWWYNISDIRYQEYYLTYSLGFIFYLRNINIMPSLNCSIFDIRVRSRHSFAYNMIGEYALRKDYFNNLLNFGVSIFFNNPFKNKEK